MRFARLRLWLVFFAICFGLGYPTLNRYDTTQKEGTQDSREYFKLVIDGPQAARGHWRSRILVPYLAKPIYWVTAGHVGSWNPVALSLLVVNSVFCASSALLLTAIARELRLAFPTALIAAFCYLLNFLVANAQLAGMVDSAETFLMTCLVLLLLRRSWNALPVLGVVGGLAKETFVPLAFLFACGWIWREKRKPWLQVCAMAATGIAVVMLVRSVVEGELVTPLQIVGHERRARGSINLMNAAIAFGTSWVLWITFSWLGLFAVPGIRSLPKEILRATAFGLAGAFALILWNNAGPNGARPFFDVAAPAVCLAFAIGVTEINDSGKRQNPRLQNRETPGELG